MSLFRCIRRPLNDHIDCLDILGRNVDDPNFYMDRNKRRCRIPRQQNVYLSRSSLDRGHGVVLVVCRYRLDRTFGLLNRGNRVLVEGLLSFLLIFLPLDMRLKMRSEGRATGDLVQLRTMPYNLRTSLVASTINGCLEGLNIPG